MDMNVLVIWPLFFLLVTLWLLGHRSIRPSVELICIYKIDFFFQETHQYIAHLHIQIHFQRK